MRDDALVVLLRLPSLAADQLERARLRGVAMQQPRPFEIGQVTEQIPAWELWEDGIEPAEDMPPRAEDKAA